MSKSEALTRSELIDQQLALSGWNVKDHTQVIEEFNILSTLAGSVAEPNITYENHQFSDYVLLGKKLIATSRHVYDLSYDAQHQLKEMIA